MLRQVDDDMVWVGDFTDDSVGTGTNGLPGADRFVYQTEDGLDATGHMLSGSLAGVYYGSKNTFDPDGMAGPAIPNGFGTDLQQWDSYGVPPGWENFIPGIGANLDGDSGAGPIDLDGGTGTDASIGLEFEITLSGAGPANNVVLVINHTYGSKVPFGDVGGCIWDCGGDDDGNVGIVDFLALLAQWDTMDSCDFDGGGVGIVDFLDLLAHWGPCP